MGFTTTLLLTIPNSFPKCSEISHGEKPLESSELIFGPIFIDLCDKMC